MEVRSELLDVLKKPLSFSISESGAVVHHAETCTAVDNVSYQDKSCLVELTLQPGYMVVILTKCKQTNAIMVQK